MNSGDLVRSSILPDTLAWSDNNFNINDVVVEERQYDLNEEKSLKKKLAATKKDDVVIYETGGGLRIVLSSGMYELLKISVDTFYTSNELKYKCQKIPVHDKQGNLVETKYKLSCGRQSVYTLNMYHTKSSCLINGKQSQQFTEDDLPQILKAIDRKLLESNTTVGEVNSVIQQLLRHCSKTSASETTNDDAPSSRDDELTALHEAVENVRKIKQKRPSASCEEDSSNDLLKDFMNTISDNILEIRRELQSHMTQTLTQIGEIKDAVSSLKKHYQLYSRDVTTSVEEVKESTHEIQHQLNSVNESVLRKLQSVTDTIKVQTSTQIPKHGGFSQKKEQSHPVLKPSPESTPQENLKREGLCRNIIMDQRQRDTDETLLKRPFGKEKTLIIGDSLLRGIQKRGLATDVEIKTMPGAKLDEVARRLMEYDLANFSNIKIYIGGNDVASGKSVTRFRAELVETTTSLQERGCVVCICNVCPRRDVDVQPLNEAIAEVCKITAATYINVISAFIYGDGTTASHYYNKDGIHLNERGTRTLVSRINKGKVIIKHKQDQFSRDAVPHGFP